MSPKECTKGTRVTYWPIRWADGQFEGPPLYTTIRHDAHETSCGLWACFVEGKAGYVLCSHLEGRSVITEAELRKDMEKDRLFVQEVINDLVKHHGLGRGHKAYDLLVAWSRELREKTHMRGRTRRLFYERVGKYLW